MSGRHPAPARPGPAHPRRARRQAPAPPTVGRDPGAARVRPPAGRRRWRRPRPARAAAADGAAATRQARQHRRRCPTLADAPPPVAPQHPRAQVGAGQHGQDQRVRHPRPAAAAQADQQNHRDERPEEDRKKAAEIDQQGQPGRPFVALVELVHALFPLRILTRTVRRPSGQNWWQKHDHAPPFAQGGNFIVRATPPTHAGPKVPARPQIGPTRSSQFHQYRLPATK